ncbi:hypothetical protein CPC16_008894 [Podila verticillata]|nr:hypothetical protein CPC16_008894 [Podila verticillata]
MPPSPINLPEICTLIAKHLSRAELLACCTVSKDWHAFFLPYLWQSVVFNAAGPIFSDSDTDPRVANIHNLKYNYGVFEGPMPRQGYIRLTELEISQKRYYSEQEMVRNWFNGVRAVNLWHLPIALLHSLADGPLSSLKVTNIYESYVEFWEATLQCRQLKSFHLRDVFFPESQIGLPLWKVCRSVETLNLSSCLPICTVPFHTRLFRLKHLTMHNTHFEFEDYDKWESVKSWLCSPNLETLEYSNSSTSYCSDEFHEMVEDIRAAKVAAAEGRNHYELAPDSSTCGKGVDEDVELYRGVIPGKALHSLETDNSDIEDEDLGFLVNNMDALRKLCVPYFSFGAVTMEALDRHRLTIVELSLLCDSVNTSQALSTVMSCAQLEILELDFVAIADFVQSEPWACFGLKRLSIAFQNVTPWVISDMNTASPAIWKRLSCLTKLERLNTYWKGNFCGRCSPMFTLECGLGQLSTLKEMRQVEVDLYALDALEAGWMIGAWPKLKLVHCRESQWECNYIDGKVMQAFKHNSIVVETLPVYSTQRLV